MDSAHFTKTYSKTSDRFGYIMEMNRWHFIAIVVIGAILIMASTSVEAACKDWDLNYKDALSKSIMFLEAQRSGKLPRNQRVSWRKDSGLNDGKDAGVDLVGGYYDAGDNVKYGLPMAFTITTLAWSALQYSSQLKSANELTHVKDAIKWGTDYFVKASRKPNELYVQVGDPHSDHRCWERPESMDTPRPVLKIDPNHPGSEIAGETAAALAASSMVFKSSNPRYSKLLLRRATLLFRFADTKRGLFKGACPFYCPWSGYEDELMWAATWLYAATNSRAYLKYIQKNYKSVHVSEFNWDLKYAGIQVMLAGMLKGQEKYRMDADRFVCSIIPGSPYSSMVYKTPGGLIYMRDGANTQYVTSAAFLLSVYSDVVAARKDKTVLCGGRRFSVAEVMGFAKKQVDYLLGKNPMGMSYMVGFGKKYPLQAHHRGASIPSAGTDMWSAQKSKFQCAEGFMRWFSNRSPNPNLLVGAIVGGPDKYDRFQDLRSDSTKEEPTTYINSLLVGTLTKLTAMTPRWC